MATARQGETLVISRNESVNVSLPVYDGGELWEVVSASCTISERPLAVAVAGGIPSARIEAFSELQTVTLVWVLTGSDTTTRTIHTQLEIVGAHLCSIADIRNYNSNANVDDFSNKTKYPDDMVFEARQLATTIIEDACGVHFTPHKRQVVIPWKESMTILPDVAVQSVATSTGTVYLISDRQICLHGATYPATISYECGYLACPNDIRQAVIKLAVTILRPLNRPEAATGESTELGYISYTLAGRDGATGIPEVDAVIERRKMRRLEVC